MSELWSTCDTHNFSSLWLISDRLSLNYSIDYNPTSDQYKLSLLNKHIAQTAYALWHLFIFHLPVQAARDNKTQSYYVNRLFA